MFLMRLYQASRAVGRGTGVFIRGDGAGKPQGVLNSPAAVSVSRDNSNEFGVADLFAMESHLVPGSEGRAMWVMHPQVKTQLGLLNAGSVQSWHPALVAGHAGHPERPADYVLGALLRIGLQGRRNADRLDVLPDRRPAGTRNGCIAT